jgi:hypothetical protein
MLNLYTKLMIRVGALVFAFVVLAFTVGSSILRELFIVGALFVPITIVMGILAVRDVAVPIRELIVASQRLLEGDYDAPVTVKRRDEIGFLASVMGSVQFYMRQHRAVVRVVFDVVTGANARATTADVIALITKVATEQLPVEALDVSILADGEQSVMPWNDDPFDPMDLTDEAVRGWAAQVTRREIPADDRARTFVLPVMSSTGAPEAVALVRQKPGRSRLGGENLKQLRVLLGALSIHLDRERVRSRVIHDEDLEQAVLALAQNPVRSSNVNGVQVPGYEVAHFQMCWGSRRTDVLSAIDLRPHGGALLLLLGDAAARGVGAAIARSAVLACCESVAAIADAHTAPNLGPGPLAVRCSAVLSRLGNDALPTSAMLLALRPGAAAVEYCNAGHCAPLFIASAHADVARELPSRGPMLGAQSGAAFEPRSQPFAPGDVVMVFSDGVIEARNGRGESFGRERCAEIARAAGGASAAEICERMRQRLEEFVGPATPSTDADDASLLVIRRQQAADVPKLGRTARGA